MTVAKLVPKKPNAQIIEALEHQLERARNGEIQSLGLVALGPNDNVFAFGGDPLAVLYGLEKLKAELLSDD